MIYLLEISNHITEYEALSFPMNSTETVRGTSFPSLSIFTYSTGRLVRPSRLERVQPSENTSTRLSYLEEDVYGQIIAEYSAVWTKMRLCVPQYTEVTMVSLPRLLECLITTPFTLT